MLLSRGSIGRVLKVQIHFWVRGFKAKPLGQYYKSHVCMEAAAEEDLQATYRKYGLNLDGTPSGHPGPGSSLAD